MKAVCECYLVYANRLYIKAGLYRIWCGVSTLGDTSAFVNPAAQVLLTRRGKTRMDGVGIIFEFYTGVDLKEIFW